jgi:hypothetical protein
MNPFLKADFPARALKRHGQGLPRCAPGFPSYDTGGQASHVIQVVPKHEGGEPPHKECATAPRLCAPSSSPQPTVKKANCRTRSVQPPRGCAPLHLRHNQRSRRRTTAQGACNRPTVCAPSSSPQPTIKRTNRHTRSVQTPRGCAPPRLRRNQRSNLWHEGPGVGVLGPTAHPGLPLKVFLGVGRCRQL